MRTEKQQQSLFRRYVKDLFPNDVVEKEILDAIEKKPDIITILHSYRLDVWVHFCEIYLGLEKEFPNSPLLAEKKLYLANLFGKQDIVKSLEKEMLKAAA